MDEYETKIADNNLIPIPTVYTSSSLKMKYRDHIGEESESLDSDNNNESDTPILKIKKPKAKRPKPVFQQQKNKYNIWCTELEVSKLTEQLRNCDVRQKYDSDQDLNPNQKVGAGNKRTTKDRRSVKLRLGSRPSMEVENPTSGLPRIIYNLNATVNESVEDIASDIANKLCEQKEELIVKVVEVAGKQKAIDLFLETQETERNGGMMIMNGSRRRTPGGVFLLLVKRDTGISPEKRKQIFSDDNNQSTERNYSHCMSWKQKAEELQRKLSANSTLRQHNLQPLTRTTELSLKQLAEDHHNKCGERCAEAQVPNTPTSPATDGRDGVPDTSELSMVNRQILTYEDDFFDIACDSMDVF